MRCRQAERWMDAALDELEGSPADPGLARHRAKLDSHLAACPRCRRQWEALRCAESVLRAPRSVPAPEGMLAEFRERLARESAAAPRPDGERARRKSFWSTLWPLGSLAAAGAAAVAMHFGVGVPPPPAPEREPEMQAVAPREAAASDPVSDAVTASPAPRPAAPDRQSTAANPPIVRADSPATPRNTGAPRFRAASRPPRTRARVADGDSRFRTPSRPPAPAPRVAQDTAAPGGLALEARTAGAAPAPEAVETSQSKFGRGAVNLGTDPLIPEQAQGKPAEVEVSPVLLAALRRTVEVSAEMGPVARLAERLAEAADVVVEVDPTAAQTTVTVTRMSAPFWQVLEEVARQATLEIYPRDNALVLRPAPAEVATPKAADEKGGASLRSPRLSKSAAAPGAPTAPPAGASRMRLENSREVSRAQLRPDRRVWPAAWGNLPERGFEIPAPAELPSPMPAPGPSSDRLRNQGGATLPRRENPK